MSDVVDPHGDEELDREVREHGADEQQECCAAPLEHDGHHRDHGQTQKSYHAPYREDMHLQECQVPFGRRRSGVVHDAAILGWIASLGKSLPDPDLRF